MSASKTYLLVLNTSRRFSISFIRLIPGYDTSLREQVPLVFKEQLNTGLIFVVDCSSILITGL